ncbi:MAG: winged helix-turn-helix domain-containing protein [Pseudomonadota bacterium]
MIFQCAGLEFDTNSFSLTREGEAVSLTPKVFDLLVFLMQHRDRLVTREELFNELWSGRVVSDNVLSNEIKLARAVLGDNGEQQKYIRTLRGRGYQFVGEVRETQAAPSPAGAASNEAAPADSPPTPALHKWRPYLALGTLVAAVAAAFLWLAEEPTSSQPTTPTADVRPNGPEPGELRPNTIAILPFVNHSQVEEDAFFVDGFHDDLITQVTKISGLAAISRTSMMAYRGSNKSMPTIGRELGAALIIEGGVQRAADSIRINVQMIDAATDEHIWAETYTRELNAENVFAIQSEITLAVATTLRAVLSQEEQQDIAEAPTQSTAALDAFFRGRVSAALTTTKGFGEAVEHYREAVRLDPEFAEAHAQLGLALLEQRTYSSLPLKENLVLAEVAVRKALSLDPALSEAYEALALLERDKGNRDAAQSAYERALELNPGNADAARMYAFFQSNWLRRHESALALLANVKAVDPQNPITLSIAGWVKVELERFDEALEEFNAAIASAPGYAETYRVAGDLYFLKLYRHDEAIKAYRRFYALDPDTAFNFLNLATAYDDLGVPDEAVRFFELFLAASPTGAEADVARIRIHLIRGEDEPLQALLEEMGERYSGQLRWVDVMLCGFDLAAGDPERAIERVETHYPEFLLGGSDVGSIPDRYHLALVYAAALHLAGRGDQAAPLTAKILEALPATSRHRWSGIQTLDTWLHMAMGNEERALESVREWRAIGGRLDLSKHRMVPESLLAMPEGQAINHEILADLAEQRAHLARMEAAGEIAPLP